MGHGGHGGGDHDGGAPSMGGWGGDGDGYAGDDGEMGDGHLKQARENALVIGMDPGLGYLRDNTPGQGPGRYWDTPHDDEANPFARATRATMLAIDKMQKHNGKHLMQLAWHPKGHLHQVPQLARFAASHPHLQTSREVFLPGIARDGGCVEVLGYFHDRFDVQGCIQELASKVQVGSGVAQFLRLGGLTSIKPPAVNSPALINKTERRLLPLSPLLDKPNAKNLPNCAFDGATGTTKVWRELYQIVPSRLLVPNFQAHRTYMVVMGGSWHTVEEETAANRGQDRVDDYETRVAFAIWSLGYTENCAWKYDWDRIAQHRDCAEQMAKGLWAAIQSHPAKASSLRARAKKGPPKPPVVTPDCGCEPVGTGVDLSTFPLPEAFEKPRVDEEEKTDE